MNDESDSRYFSINDIEGLAITIHPKGCLRASKSSPKMAVLNYKFNDKPFFVGYNIRKGLVFSIDLCIDTIEWLIEKWASLITWTL